MRRLLLTFLMILSGTVRAYVVRFECVPDMEILKGNLIQELEYGTETTPVLAMPTEHYRFVCWRDGDTGETITADNIAVINVTGDLTAVAIYRPLKYRIEIMCGEHGRITGDRIRIRTFKETVTSTAVPDEGYRFLKWINSSGKEVSTLSELEAVCSGPESYTAVFTASDELLTVTVYASGTGSVTGEKHQLIERGGTMSAVTAVPDEGYIFTGWTGEIISAENPLAVKVDKNLFIRANFSRSAGTHIVRLFSSPSGAGKFIRDRICVRPGDSVDAELSGFDSTDYVFYGYEVSPAESDIEIDGEKIHISDINGDIDCTAIFRNINNSGHSRANFLRLRSYRPDNRKHKDSFMADISAPDGFNPLTDTLTVTVGGHAHQLVPDQYNSRGSFWGKQKNQRGFFKEGLIRIRILGVKINLRETLRENRLSVRIENRNKNSRTVSEQVESFRISVLAKGSAGGERIRLKIRSSEIRLYLKIPEDLRGRIKSVIINESRFDSENAEINIGSGTIRVKAEILSADYREFISDTISIVAADDTGETVYKRGFPVECRTTIRRKKPNK